MTSNLLAHSSQRSPIRTGIEKRPIPTTPSSHTRATLGSLSLNPVVAPEDKFFANNIASGATGDLDAGSAKYKVDLKSRKIDYVDAHELEEIAEEFPDFPIALLQPTVGYHRGMFSCSLRKKFTKELADLVGKTPITFQQCDVGEEFTLGESTKDLISDKRIDAMASLLRSFDQHDEFNMFDESEQMDVVTFFRDIFGGVVGVPYKHELRHLLGDIPTSPVFPDFTAGPLLISYEGRICSRIEGLHNTVEFLQQIYDLVGKVFGCGHEALPVVVGEFVEKDEDESDFSNLLDQMATVRSTMELVWRTPPKYNFGFSITHYQWRVLIMRRDGDGYKARLLFAHKLENIADRLFVLTIACRLASYILEELVKAEPVPDQDREVLLGPLRSDSAVTISTTTWSTQSEFSRTTSVVEDSLSRNSESKDLEEENQSPSKNAKSKEQRMVYRVLSMREIREKIYITWLDGEEVIMKTGSVHDICHQCERLLDFKGQYVVELLAYGDVKLGVCIIMPKHAPLPSATSVDEVIRMATQILTALAKMHAKDYIHGDVKTSNIVWDERVQEIRFIDFETSEKVDDNGRVKGRFGTETFMAPEVLTNHWVSRKSDIFSAGLVIASLIYDIRIKNEKSRQQVLSYISERKSSPLASPALLSVVAKMLEPSEDERYTASEALEALAIASQPVTCPDTSTSSTVVAKKNTIVLCDDKENVLNGALSDMGQKVAWEVN